MQRDFDDRDFEQLAAEARRLAADTLRHERDLAALVERLERRANSGPAVAAVATPGSVDGGAAGLLALADVDLVAHIRQLCVDARENRLRAERCAVLLTGGSDLDFSGAPKNRDLTPDAAGAGNSRPPRVLVVDDAEDIREVLTIAFRASGIETITAADGLEGLIAAHAARPAVILMDVNMPVLNGIEATRLLRAAAVTRDTPVIAHTARPELLAEPFVRLFEHVVPKPAAPEIVVAAVRSFLDAGEPSFGAADDGA